MFNVIIYLGVGILTGLLLHKLTWIPSILERIITTVIYLLLFTLGLRAGLDRAITSQLYTLGLTACLISLFAMAGSIGISWIIYKWIFKSKLNEK